MRIRLDKALVERHLTSTRSQAESYIKLGFVTINDQPTIQPARMVAIDDVIKLNIAEQYVSRAGLKLASVSYVLKLDFKAKVVLDVGSSTGGFTDFALKNGAKKVIAVEIGKEQLHPSLRNESKIELYEQTDIRDVDSTSSALDIVVIDVSFTSLRTILPSVFKLSNESTQIVAMFKPQFEAGSAYKHKGVIKNDKIRRQLLSEFELWIKQNKFRILNQADSEVKGSKGNKERFYLLKITN